MSLLGTLLLPLPLLALLELLLLALLLWLLTRLLLLLSRHARCESEARNRSCCQYLF